MSKTQSFVGGGGPAPVPPSFGSIYLYEGDCPEPPLNRLTLVGPCDGDYRTISNANLLGGIGFNELWAGDKSADVSYDLSLGKIIANTTGPYHVCAKLDFSPGDGLIHNVFFTAFKNNLALDELHSVRTGSGVGVIYPQHQSITGIINLVAGDFVDCRLTVPPELQAIIDIWYYNLNIHRIA